MDMKAIAMGVGFALIWASAFTATRVIVTAAPPLTGLVIRFALSAAIGIALARGLGQSWRLSRAEWRTVVIFGSMQNGAYLGLNWVAMQEVEASAAAVIASMMPLLVAAAGWVWLGEKIRRSALIGLVLGLAGVSLVMAVRLQHGVDPFGVALCLLGVVALTVATLSVRGASGSRNMLMMVSLQMAVGALTLLIPALILERGAPIGWSPSLVGAFLYAIIGPGLLATLIWFRLVTRIGAVRAATFHFLSPLFGVGLAAALLQERFGLSDMLGALIIAAGIFLVQISRLPGSGAPLGAEGGPHHRSRP